MSGGEQILVKLKRNRLNYAIIIMGIFFLGISSRKFPGLFPDFVAAYAGDTLWAMMVFFLVGLLFPSRSIFRAALATLIFSYLVEVSQFYHAPWIDAIRSTTLGGLVLGFGFQWSDLICYTVGITTGVLLEILIFRNQTGSVLIN